ncbi:MAG: YafY family protein [Sulfitobacter sp.]
MTAAERLFQITRMMQDGKVVRASDIAAQLGVSLRTIYRDMDRLVASGLPLHGTRGTGYRLEQTIPLPPLVLTPDELEALTLGLAVVGQAADETLKAAAATLSEKIDAASSTAGPHMRYASSPFADATRNLAYMPLLRSAITARQKVRITYTSDSGAVTTQVIRPLRMAYWGHVWAITAWCEMQRDFNIFRLDLMENVEALPELFVDEPGKRIDDYTP